MHSSPSAQEAEPTRSKPAIYLRWHNKDAPYLRRKRLRLESLLGAACSYCGLTREQGVNLQFHHHAGRDWHDSKGRPTSPHKLSWSMRLTRYEWEIRTGVLLYLACDQSGNNCHEKCKRQASSQPAKLYGYEETNSPF